MLLSQDDEMRNFTLTFLFLFISFISFSQKESIISDTVEQQNALSIEISPGIAWNTIFDETTAYGGLEVNTIIQNKFIIGVYGEYFLGELSMRIVFPNFYVFDHYKLGLVGGYNFQVSDKFHIRPKLKFLYCEARWTEKEEKRFYTSDQYLEYFPEMMVALFPKKKIYVNAGIGYHFTSSSNLIGASDSDLSGLNLSAGIHIKLFER